MKQRFYVDDQGNYIGSYCGPDEQDIYKALYKEVLIAPAHALDKWDGQQWLPYVAPIPLADQLNAAFSELSEDLQADFAPLKAAVKLELEQGRVNIAKKIIERAVVPDELKAVQSGLVGFFNG